MYMPIHMITLPEQEPDELRRVLFLSSDLLDSVFTYYRCHIFGICVRIHVD